jgi:iron complex outermembrane recepter protein
MHKFILVLLAFSMGLGIDLGCFSMVNAQVAPDNEFTLEEITVTAQKRAENAQATPISISYTNGDEAIRDGLSNVGEVLQTVPGVHLEPITKGASIYIRGVGANLDPQIASPAVNFNIDGRYQHQTSTTYSAFYDVNHVEVLRGPQGTLFGRNATAGSINVITNDPKDKFDSNATFQLGNYNLIRADAMVNTPINDSSALRLAMSTEKHDGYLTTGTDNADNKSVRAKFLIKSNDDFRLLFTADSSTIKGVYGTVVAPLNSRSNPWESVDHKGQSDVETWSASAQLDWNAGFADFTFVPSFQSYRLESKQTWAGGYQEMKPTEKQTTVEARLASRPETYIRWLAGVYYLDSTRTDNVYSPERDALTLYPKIATSSYAGFGQLNMPLGERINAYLGLRYTKDEQSNHGIITTPISSTGDFYSSNNWNSVDYRVGVDINVTDSSLLYAQVASGYKAGGFFQGAMPNSYEPEKLVAYQIGSKNQFINNRLQINGEAFYYDYKNYQVLSVGVINPPPAFGLIIVNAGKATIYGGELESTMLLTVYDKLQLSLAYLHGKFDTLVVPFFGLVPGADYSGEKIPNSPSWSGNLGYEHVWILSSGAAISAKGEVKFSTGYYPSYQQFPETHQDSYTLSNLYLGYEAETGKYSIRSYVKNVGNKAVINSGYQLSPFNPVSAMLNSPRTYGLIISVKY